MGSEKCSWSLIKLRCQLSILRQIEKEYSHHTIENVIQQLESREKYLASKWKHSWQLFYYFYSFVYACFLRL